MAKVDPITFAVVRNNLMSVANGMQEVAYRCAVTPMMYEIHDCCFGLLDADAGVIAQSQGMVLFLGSLGPATQNCLDLLGKENLEPGDVIICSVPHLTGSHASDGLLFTPIFYKGKLFGFAATKTHWQDMGAKSFYPMDSRSIYEEGLHIPPMRFYKKGKLQTEIWDMIKWNSRAPDMVWGDMSAQIAGCHFAERRVMELLEKYGFDTVNACIAEMYDYGERITRMAIDEIPDGSWSAEDYMDNNGIDLDTPVKMKVTVTVKGSDITIDYTGSAPEQKGPINGLLVATIAVSRIAVKALTSPRLPANEGFFRPVTVIAPENTIYNSSPTAPSFLFSWPTHHVIELINKALYKVLPMKIPACSGADVCIQGFTGINPRNNEYWQSIISPNIGQGGDYFSDGESYLFHHGGASCKNVPTEVLETLTPVFVERNGLITDGGGPGKYRGGVGSRIDYRLLAPARFFSNIEKAKTPLWGIDGGKEGVRNNLLVKPHDGEQYQLLKTSYEEMMEGDSVTGIAGGGCGYGNPFERDLEAVRQDVIDGYVSVERAGLDYGVVINPDNFDIDVEATKKLRSNPG